jgi:tetratricopeptide (TPR) repeat protein
LTNRRQLLHEAAGRAVEHLYSSRVEEHYERLAYHYERSAHTDKAFEYLALANEKAMKADAPMEAKGYFERAMALLDTLPDNDLNRRRRLTLLASQIVLFQNLFQMQEYFELLTRYEPVAHELNDASLLGPIIQQLGHCDWTFGRFVDAHRRFEEAAPLLEATDNYAVAAQTYQIWMWNHLCLGHFQDVLALEERVEIAWKKQPNLRWYVYALSADAETYGYLGRFTEALATAHKALAVAERFEDAAQISFAAWSVGLAYLMQGDLQRAIKYATLGVEKAPTPAERAWAAGSLAAAQCRAGRFEEALAVLPALFAGMRGGAFVPGERFAPYLGEAYLGAGRYEEGHRAIEEGLIIQQRHGMRYEAGQSYRLMGEWALLINPEQSSAPLAEAYLNESIKLLGPIQALPDLARTYSAVGRLRVCQRRWSEAREAFHCSLKIVEQIGLVGESDRLKALLSSVPLG